MNFWDTQYSVAGYKYGTAPNAFLVLQAEHFPQHATILLPGDGEGRNSVWLAEQGHQVTSIDASAVAIEKAQSLAKDTGVVIKTHHSDLGVWAPDPESADVVVLTYLHLAPEIRTEVHQKVITALKPGALVVLEAFHPNQLNYASGGPKSIEMLYTLALIRSDFGSGVQELYGTECETLLDEGPGHNGPAYVTRWVGKKRT